MLTEMSRTKYATLCAQMPVGEVEQFKHTRKKETH